MKTNSRSYRPPTIRDQTTRDLDAALELRAIVASGDCFDLLANRLDQIMRISDERVARPELERLIRLLLELQNHYKIVAKPSAPPLVV